MVTRSPQLSTFAPGSVVAIRYFIVKHVGIVSDVYDDDGFPFIISNTRRKAGVAEEPQAVFAAGRKPYLLSEPAESAAVILDRARACLGRRYDLGLYNCEHFVSGVTGNSRKSRQLRIAGMVGGAFAALVIGVGRLPK